MPKWEDAQDTIAELRSEVESDTSGILDDLDTAGSCENSKDFSANLASAYEGAQQLLKRIEDFRKEHKIAAK